MSSKPFSATPELHDLPGFRDEVLGPVRVELTCHCGQSYVDVGAALNCTHE